MLILLREFIHLQLSEKIKRDVDPNTGKARGRFDLQVLKNFRKIPWMLEYAYDRLRYLGAGTARDVFLLSSRKVLKVAINEAGIAQNERELEISKDPDAVPFVAKVFDAHPKNAWLISELVRPIKGDDFKDVTGMSFKTYWDAMKGKDPRATTGPKAPRLGEPDDEQTGPAISKKSMQHKASDTNVNEDFIDGVVKMVQKHGMVAGDVLKENSWGKTGDNRIVLLDYGFTDDIRSNYYKSTEMDAGGGKKKRGLTVDPNVEDYLDDEDTYTARADAQSRKRNRLGLSKNVQKIKKAV